MNILIPTHAFTDSPQSGLHSAVWNTTKHLASRGHVVHVIATHVDLKEETPQTLKTKRVILHHIAQYPMHNLTKPLALRCFLTALRLRFRHRFDWIYVIDSARTPFHWCKLGARLATRMLAPDSDETRKMFTTGEWGYDRKHKAEEEGWGKHGRPLWYRLFSLLADIWFFIVPTKHPTHGADLVFCQGKETYDYWKTRISGQAVELSNGVDAELFKQQGGAPPRKTDRFVFLFVGRIAKRKGIFHLLNAFETLRREREDVELWIAGKGSKTLKREMQEHIKNDQEHIHYFGEISRSQAPVFFRACSALVDPMIYQGFSTVCVEAMYCFKPVIASLFGGTKDVVENGVNGLLVDPRNEKELLAAMKKLIEDPGRAEQMAQKGREKVQSTFLWEHVVGIIEDAFTHT